MIYPFLECLGWFLHGLLQKILLWAPLVDPLQEPLYPPTWWLLWYPWNDWIFNLDADRRPNATFVDLYISAAWRHVREEFFDVTRIAREALKAFILMRLGALRPAFGSFGEWVDHVHDVLGDILPSWATDAIAGLWWLYWHFPQVIRLGSQTWEDIWDGIKEAVRDWALNFYASTVQRALDVWSWLMNVGRWVEDWWRETGPWLLNLVRYPYTVIAAILGAAWSFLVGFASNPVGYVTGWLSPWWQPLTVFARDCLVFWYNTWSWYSDTLIAFLSDPLAFIGDRVEAIIEDRW